jgi:SAM-dependent methyltransferase
MGIQQFMAAQLRQPKGWFGSLVLSRVMNRVNRQIIDSTLALLKLDAQSRVLEIGFGGGMALVLLAKLVSSGVVSGVDISADMGSRKAGCRCNLAMSLISPAKMPFSIVSSPSIRSISGLTHCEGWAK